MTAGKISKYIFTTALFIIWVVGMVCPVHAQEEDQEQDLDALLEEILAYDSLLLDEFESDSISILTLLDSLISTDHKYSSMSLRIGYISDILNAGRDFGVKQFGLASGASYYHKSGLFGDLNAYWNSNVEPEINPVTTSIGYMGISGKWLSYFLSYDHYFYSKIDDPEIEVYYPITNALNGSAYADIMFFTTGIDYSFLFGDEKAHRFRGSIYVPINLKKVPIFDRISLFPTASILAGNQNIYTISVNYQLLSSLTTIYQTVGKRKFSRLYDKYQDQIEENIYQEEVENVFGIMNYGLSLPVYLYIDNFSFALAYYHNFPQALTGEFIEYEPNGYFSFSLIYNIPFFNLN